MMDHLKDWVVDNDVGRCVIACEAFDKLTKRARAG